MSDQEKQLSNTHIPYMDWLNYHSISVLVIVLGQQQQQQQTLSHDELVICTPSMHTRAAPTYSPLRIDHFNFTLTLFDSIPITPSLMVLHYVKVK